MAKADANRTSISICWRGTILSPRDARHRNRERAPRSSWRYFAAPRNNKFREIG
jgi:hypothetical protein